MNSIVIPIMDRTLMLPNWPRALCIVLRSSEFEQTNCLKFQLIEALQFECVCVSVPGQSLLQVPCFGVIIVIDCLFCVAKKPKIMLLGMLHVSAYINRVVLLFAVVWHPDAVAWWLLQAVNLVTKSTQADP